MTENIQDIKNSIEVKADKQNGFMNKKRFILISVFILITILLFVLTLVFVLNIDFPTLFKNISDAFTYRLGWLWFSILFIYMPVRFFLAVIPFAIRMRKIGLKLPFWERFLYGFNWAFLTAVTPANLVTDPYTIFWLKSNGVPNSRAASITLSNAVIWQIIQLIITFPSLVYIGANYGDLTTYTGAVTAYWIMVAGFCVHCISVSFLTGITLSRYLQTFASLTFNWLKKILHLKYHTVAETKEKYLKQGKFRQEINQYLRDWQSTIWIVIAYLFAEAIPYVLVYVSLLFMTKDGWSVNFWGVFNAANLSITGNKFIPLPGNQGLLEWTLKCFMISAHSVRENGHPISEEQMAPLVSNTIIIWRTFTTYVPAMIGFGGFISMITLYYRKFKSNKESFFDSKID